MIKLETLQITGWEPAFHGMRNPMNSWAKADSYTHVMDSFTDEFVMGPNDHDLAMRLAKGGSTHAKYRRMIAVYVDITAPLYFWKEFDTYKIGTVANSCSTMHKIHAKEFTLEDFSCEKLFSNNDSLMIDLNKCCTETGTAFFMFGPLEDLKYDIDKLNIYRQLFIQTKNKIWWEQMIQRLPSSYNQKRTIMLNYEVLVGMYRDRKNHKLDEWRELCKWIEGLPYAELIIGESEKTLDDYWKLATSIAAKEVKHDEV